jgi:hypothetical protein
MSGRLRKALVAGAGLLVLTALGSPRVALAQPSAASAVEAARSDALVQVRAQVQAAQQALGAAADEQAIARASDQLRQALSAQIAVSTAGLAPDATGQAIANMAAQGRQRQAELEKTAGAFLRDRLAGASNDAERAAAYRAYDSAVIEARISEEVAGEAQRRLSPVITVTYAGDAHREPYNSTQARMEDLLKQISDNYVEEPRLPSYTNPDGSRASAQDREIEEHLRRLKREADIREYLHLAQGGVFVNPATGAALSQEMRDRIAKNATLILADLLKSKGIENSALRTLFGWTDSRSEIGQQIEQSVRSNSWYQALDLINPSVTGADPKMIALAMASVLRSSADQVYAWRTGQLPEGGNGGITGWLYENFVAKQKVGVGTALRVKDLEKGGEIDKQIEAYTAEVDAAVAALNEMAKTPDPKDLSAANHRLLEGLGFISRTPDGKETYRIPSGDTAARLQQNLHLPGATLLDLISGANAMKVVLMVATPQLIAAKVGVALEGLELGAGAIRTGEFLATALANASLDAGFQKYETGTVQWDRLVLDTVVVNLGLGVASEATGVVAKGVVGAAMGAEARELAKTFAKNAASRELAEGMVAQILGLTGDSALLTYWQGKFQPTGMSFDDFLANVLNGLIGRVAPVAGKAGVTAIKTATGLGAAGGRGILMVGPRSLRDAILGLSPALREAFVRGLTPDQLSRFVEDARFAEAEHARKAAIERLSTALGEDYLKLDLKDPALIDKVTTALEAGTLSFTDLKAVLGETPALTGVVDGVNAYRLKVFDQIIDRAKTLARNDIEAEYAARMQKFKDALGEGSEIYKQAEADAKAWRDGELAKLEDSAKVADAAPGSKNNTSDIDRSLTSTFLRNTLKVATDEWFQRRGATRGATSAAAYDVNEYYNTMKFIEYLKEQKVDLKTATHKTPDGVISHADMMEAMGLATAMMEMPPAQREQFEKTRTATGGERMMRLFSIAKESLAKADAELKAEVARLSTQGYDPNSPDTVTRARDNLYGKRASELAEREATLRRLVAEKSPYAAQLAGEMEVEWAMTMREGIEAYTSFTGLEIIVSKAQIDGVSVREMIEGKVDPKALEKFNAKAREENKTERTATKQQEMIDKALAEGGGYSKGQLAAALDDQIRFMTHHIDAFYEGHESATQVASALSKYAERTVLFMKLMGLDVSTGPGKELSDISKDLVKNRGDLAKLKAVVTGYGGGDEAAGIRKLIALLGQTAPGMKGLFDPAVLEAVKTGPANDHGPGTTGTNSAALNAILRQREIERRQQADMSGSRAVVQSTQTHKAQLENELAQLKAEKADEARLATQYNRSDWNVARELEAERDALQLEIGALPITAPMSETYKAVAEKLRQTQERLDQLKAKRTATGGGQATPGATLRDKRIASLELQIKDDQAAIGRYEEQARQEEARAAQKVQTGNTGFNPVEGLTKVSAPKPSSTPELDKLGAYLRDEVDKGEIKPPSSSDTTRTPGAGEPAKQAPPSGADARTATGGCPEAARCASLKIAANGRVLLTTADGVVYPGTITADGFQLYAPGSKPDGAATPILVAQAAPLPTGKVIDGPDGSVTYVDVPVGGLGGEPGGGREATGPAVLVFTQPKPRQPEPKSGGGDGGGQVMVDGPTAGMGDLASGPGMGWGETETFVRNPITQTAQGQEENHSTVGPSAQALANAAHAYADQGEQETGVMLPMPRDTQLHAEVVIPHGAPQKHSTAPSKPTDAPAAAPPAPAATTPVVSTPAPAASTPATPTLVATTPAPRPPAPVTPAVTTPTPQPAPPPSVPATPSLPAVVPPQPAPQQAGFTGNWVGGGGCGFSQISISQSGNQLQLQGLPGNGTVQASVDGQTAAAQGVVMFGKSGHYLSLSLQGGAIAFQARNDQGGHCSDSLRRQ